MTLQLLSHPFSSYCQKALIAFYENATPFEHRMLDPEHPENFAALERVWPIKKFPVLIDGERSLFEATVIIEYLDLHYAGAVRFIPRDAEAALEVRMLDRFFDNYVMTPMQRIVADFMRKPEQRDAKTVSDAKAMLETAYAFIEARIGEREWIAGSFGLADCAAAPSLFYADWVHPVPEKLGRVRAYRARLLKRPSFARVVDEARPYRHFFPPGAPNRD